MMKKVRKKVSQANASTTKKLKKLQKNNEILEKSLEKCQAKYKAEVKQAIMSQRQAQTFARLILKQHEEEKKNISRELHDGIAQLLAGINFELEIISTETKNSAGQIHDKIINTQKLIEHSVEVLHRFARELRPIMLDDLGLTAGIRSYIKEFSRQNKIKTKVQIQSNFPYTSELQKIVIFRLIQEAFSNINKHAKATKINITLKIVKNNIVVEVKDNGISFNTKNILNKKNSKHLGLLGMKERINIAKGTLSIISIPKKGTTISATIPLEKKIIATL
jgi:two-component system sensor histidine kinase DegS